MHCAKKQFEPILSLQDQERTLSKFSHRPPPRQNPFAPINFHYRERTQKEDFKQILSLSSNSRLPGLMNRQSLFADINPRVPGVLFGWLNLNREGPIKE